jgi:hypothetical protein
MSVNRPTQGRITSEAIHADLQKVILARQRLNVDAVKSAGSRSLPENIVNALPGGMTVHYCVQVYGDIVIIVFPYCG